MQIHPEVTHKPQGGDASSAVAHYEARPTRTGMWFLVHREVLGSIECENTVDIFQEFFALHPNCDDRVKSFIAVQLSYVQLKRQSARIRMASYRWEAVKGVGEGDSEFAIPQNYGWFLDHIQANRQIGWLDFVANVGINVPIHETIAYMGQLYAQQIVVADWLLSLAKLEEAMTRGWIYQESAFGTLDMDCLTNLCSEMRAIAQRYISVGDEPSCIALFKACRLFAKLFERRALNHTNSFMFRR